MMREIEEIDLIEKLFEELARKGACLPKNFTVVFPRECRPNDLEARLKGIKREMTCQDAVYEIEKLFEELFGGFTRYDATGGWMEEIEGELVEIREPVAVIMAGRECFKEEDVPKFRKLFGKLKELGKKTGQTSIMISVDNTRVAFFSPKERLPLEKRSRTSR